MRSSLENLPHQKQRELERVRQIVFEEFDAVLSLANAPWKKRARIEKLVLYGSYARGGWVDEPHTAKGYKSDYDLLIIVNDARLCDRAEYWMTLEDRFYREIGITNNIKTPVNFIVHTLQEVNDNIAHGMYFFLDVAKEGIALYQYEDSELHKPKPKTPAQALSMAESYFKDKFKHAISGLKGYRFFVSEHEWRDAAFMLHQTVERLYDCVLLVCTFYSPHIHNIGYLRSQCEAIDVRLVHAWPRETRAQRAYFNKLKEAYVKSRYSDHYTITEEQLLWIGNCVEELGKAVNAVCTDRIAKLREQAEQPPFHQGQTSDPSGI
jgi:predicted nucleotidyltransferase/HEPN domain-containing protein